MKPPYKPSCPSDGWSIIILSFTSHAPFGAINVSSPYLQHYINATASLYPTSPPPPFFRLVLTSTLRFVTPIACCRIYRFFDFFKYLNKIVNSNIEQKQQSIHTIHTGCYITISSTNLDENYVNQKDSIVEIYLSLI